MPSRKSSTLPHWQRIVSRFPAARDCLTSFLAYETAELLAGVKPANLINLVNRPHHCGRNFYRLWQEWGPEVLASCGLVGHVLIDRGESLLLLVYEERQMQGLLAKPAVRAMLRRVGYPESTGSTEILAHLEERCHDSATFPHEIGIFLGYPLKDVAAFLGWIAIPFTVQGPWKIYGRADESLLLAEEHRRCRSRMARRLALCRQPGECLCQVHRRAVNQ